MTKWIKRKEFEKIFLPFNENGKQVWIIGRVKKLSLPVVNMALNIVALDFIKYVRICDETLAASSENYPNRLKVPPTPGDLIPLYFSTNRKHQKTAS